MSHFDGIDVRRMLPLLLFSFMGGPALAFSLPDCDGLRAWSSEADPRDSAYRLAAGIGAPSIFAADTSGRTFGLPARDWSSEQLDAVSEGLGACQRSARQAKDRDAVAVFRSAAAAIKAFAKARVAVDKALAEVATHKAGLGALPDSPELAGAARALAATDPAKPQPIRGLARDLARPVNGLLKALPQIPESERVALAADLEELADAIWERLAAALDAQLAAAGEGVDGILTLQTVRLRALEMGAAPALDVVVARAEQAIAGRRSALRERGGQWVPPGCDALYAWSGAADARERLVLGRQSSYSLFDAAASSPVFGKALVDWSDQELAGFATLRELCRREWQRQLQAGPARRLEQVGDDAPAVLQAARTGYWIDDADALVLQARERLQAHRAAVASLAEARQTAAGLAESPDSLARLTDLARLPALQEVDNEEQRVYQAAIAERRAEIAHALVVGAVAGAEALPITGLADLPQLWTYADETRKTLTDRDVQARLQPLWQLAVARHLDRLQPEFEQRLAAMPISLQGMSQAWQAVETLTGARGARDEMPFTAYRLTAGKRVRVIHDALQTRYCAGEGKRLGLDGGDGRQLVWDGGQGMPLAEVACAMAAAGNPLSEYEGPGMFSKAQHLKADVAGFGYHTVELHKAEVAAGTEMLLGHRMRDANGERAIQVQEWLSYLAQATRPPYRGDRRCAGLGDLDGREPEPAEGLLALRCLLPGLPSGARGVAGR